MATSRGVELGNDQVAELGNEEKEGEPDEESAERLSLEVENEENGVFEKEVVELDSFHILSKKF